MQEVVSNKEWLEISLALEQHHAVFYKIWQMGKPVFSEEIETAAVGFDKMGKFVLFTFNPKFWNKIEFEHKLFVIAHEALHIILNHGLRAKDSGKANNLAVNYAIDIVVNHSLVENFGFSRENIFGQENYCWVDTIFKHKNPLPPTTETFEFYYNLFDKTYGDGWIGDGEGGGTPVLVDDHDLMEESSQIIEELNKKLSPEEKKSLQGIIEKHFQEKEKNPTAGSGTGGWDFVNVSQPQKKKKWESIIKKWSKKYLSDKDKDQEQWATIDRRLNAMSRHMFLPSEREIEEADDNKKIDVYFYLDTSGSCGHLKDRFFTAAMSLPEERFNVRLFCFDTKVEETTIESKKILAEHMW